MKQILILGLLLIFSSCMKAPDTDIHYGPEVSAQEVATALNDAMGPSSPDKIKLNEYSEVITTRRIRGKAAADILGANSLSVTKRDETQDQIQFYYVEEKIDYDANGGIAQKLSRDFQECINKSTLRSEACAIFSTQAKEFQYSDNTKPHLMSVIKGFTQEEDAKATYHNLVVTRSLESPPEAVAKSENCQGIKDCKIHYININYDFVDWSEPEGNKIAIRLKISPDAPYLSRLMDKCQQGSIAVPQPGKPKVEYPRYLLTFCDTVTDFKFGSP